MNTRRYPLDTGVSSRRAGGRLWLRCGALSIAALALLVAAGWGGLLTYRWLDAPLNTIAIASSGQQVARAELEVLVNSALDGGFLSLDLDALCAALVAHPWIAEVRARRHWPDRLEIKVVEEVAIAHWGDQGFLNRQGETLHVADHRQLPALPYLSGPEGSVDAVMREYRDVSEVLLNSGLRVLEFGMDRHERRKLRLDAGFTVLLGQRRVLARVQRFAQVWVDGLRHRQQDIAGVDARYENGVAVAWHQNIAQRQTSTFGRPGDELRVGF